MSNSKENLVLHLKLDKIVEDGDTKKVIDVSDGNHDCEVKGEVQVVQDETFGSCLSFDGNKDNYIEVPGTTDDLKISGDLTVEAWVYITETSSDWVGIVGKGTGNGINYGLWYDSDSDLFQQYTSPGNSIWNVQKARSLKLNKWYHLTGVSDQSKNQTFLYMDGKEIARRSEAKTSVESDQPLWIGYATNYGSAHKGRIAHVRVYNTALSPEEIQQDINEDLTAIASFKKTHPLDFNLYEGEDKEPVIFIENGTKGQELILEIVNDSEQPITLPPKTSSVSSTNYHFELRFRPDTLSPDSLPELALAEKQNWSMSSAVTQDDGKVSLYFLTNDLTLGAKETIPLTLQNINGAAAGGARTTRVELKCPQFTHEGETFSNYYREKTLNILSHRGKKNIPLHVGFVGSNRILNDNSSQNQLILRITNVLKDKSIRLNKASKLIISFDVQAQGERKEWALLEAGQVAGVNVEYEGKEIINSGKESQSPEWIITFGSETVIEAGQHHQVQLSGIISSLPSGQANLCLRYENIPGYWDGTFVCTIEKSPILYKDGNVGIGVTNPGQKLVVSSKRHSEEETKQTGSKMTMGGSLAIISDAPQIDFIDTGHNDWSICVDGNKMYFIQEPWDFQVVLDGRGNVGIGTDVPGAKLDVKGRIKDKTGFVIPVGTVVAYAGTTAPEGWLLCNGQQVNDSKYFELATVLGESRVPFNVPDYREKFLVGANLTEKYKLGKTGGKSSVKLSVGEMPEHSHSGKTNNDGTHAHTQQQTAKADNDDNDDVTQNLCTQETNYNRRYDGIISAWGSMHSHQFNTNSVGGGRSHENLPPFVALNYIIKY
ncbi:MAG: hypothetical protein F6K23_02895 [Okeania sp. SIO2C9]|uniref:LamG-like jellyroll fold domain-containing protein n=1 Tax=Okeania sp. SIO2C9 TaxID=2607791 RepID=UPI0013C23692|nr:LamG-like jellyroll fold domain-containing protein [Okeania sp. SIO2C9]NEQ72114.1 hypothetical protein [Okeania sp. SIO2C9]